MNDSMEELKDEEFVVGSLLGKGSVAKVYDGKWIGSGGGKSVAIREISGVSEEGEKFLIQKLKELESILEVDYRYLPRLYGYTKPEKSKIRIIMDLLDGDIRSYLKKEVTLYKKFQIMKKITASVHFLHSQFIVHRDIRSFNFLWKDDASVVCINKFRLFIKNQTNAKSVGCHRWGAPETIDLNEGDVVYSFSSDIYSLGITFWEVLFEKIPYSISQNDLHKNDLTLMAMIKDHGFRPFMGDNSLPECLKLLILDCTHPIPSKRPEASDLLKWFDEHEGLFKNSYDKVMKFGKK